VTVAEQLLEVNGAFSVGPPKSAAGRRTVTLPAVVVDALAEHLRRYTARSPEAFVFLSSQGRHLRHTAGTLATAAGGSLREVMTRLGHSTTVAAVRYQHVMADRDAAIAHELNRLIESG
jgi:integrase